MALVINLEDLDPNIKTFLFQFDLEKRKPPHNSTLYIFNQEANFSVKWWNETKNDLTGKYIMELSKLKQLQRYMNKFELEYREFE